MTYIGTCVSMRTPGNDRDNNMQHFESLMVKDNDDNRFWDDSAGMP